jgi:hypothetical protein
MPLKQILLSTAACLVLSSCGGAGDLQLSEGGIGGTGISVGSITAFGSIWVNGVRYDVSEAGFIRDGVSAPGQDTFRIGEVVTITGSVNTDGVSGTAQTVEFKDVLEGTVSQVSTDGSTIEVLGQTIHADALTVFHGFGLLSDLQLGNVLEISGVYDAQGMIRASSITLKQSVFISGESMLEVKGRISELNPDAKTFLLDQLLVDYSLADLSELSGALAVGQYVEVESKLALQGGILLASKVETEDEYTVFESGQEVELEGLVTQFISANQFSVNGQPVITDTNTLFEKGTAADIQLNSFIEVEGYINTLGVLVADEVSVKQASATEAVEVEGSISALDFNANELTVQGTTVVVDNSTILLDETSETEYSIRFSDLRVNDFIEVKGTALLSGKLLALRIDRELEEEEEE